MGLVICEYKEDLEAVLNVCTVKTTKGSDLEICRTVWLSSQNGLVKENSITTYSSKNHGFKFY